MVEEIEKINSFISVLSKWKKTESWYSSKVKYTSYHSIRGVEHTKGFTLNEWKKIKEDKLSYYNLLIRLCESAYKSVKENHNDSDWCKPFHEDLEREYVLIENE